MSQWSRERSGHHSSCLIAQAKSHWSPAAEEGLAETALPTQPELVMLCILPAQPGPAATSSHGALQIAASRVRSPGPAQVFLATVSQASAARFSTYVSQEKGQNIPALCSQLWALPVPKANLKLSWLPCDPLPPNLSPRTQAPPSGVVLRVA